MRYRRKLEAAQQVSGRVKWRTRSSEFCSQYCLGWKHLLGTFFPGREESGGEFISPEQPSPPPQDWSTWYSLEIDSHPLAHSIPLL